MKKYISAFIVFLILQSTHAIGQSGKGRICFIRPGGYTAAAVSFRVFVDDSLVCSLKNNNYSIHSVSTGNHGVSGQNTGLTLDPGSKPLKVNVEEGKTVYISVVWVSNSVMCQEITENSAMEALKKSKKATYCGEQAKP